MRRIGILCLILIGLAGCTGAPQIINPAPPGVSFRFQGGDIAAANQRADHYCGQFGKRAQLGSVNHQGTDNIAVYQCG